MATRDNISDQRVVEVDIEIPSSNTDFPLSITDTADFDMGVMFTAGFSQFTDGSYAFAIFESDDPAMAGATVVGPEKIIGSLPILDASTGGGPNVQWDVFGVHSTKRFLQIVVTVTGGISFATFVVLAIMKGEYSPQSRV